MRFACAVTLALLLCGCTSASTPTTGPAGPPSAPTTASASASAPASAPSVPSDAIDVSAYRDADFASPDGSVRCSLTSEDASCDFPSGMKRTGVPPASKVCPGAPLKVAGVTVSGLAEYFCSRGDDAHPQQKGTAAVWARSAGVPTVTVGKEVLVTLPDGKTLKHGRLFCTSANGAITCGQTQTKASFTISRSGVKLSAGK
jgi:hypothetical protein